VLGGRSVVNSPAGGVGRAWRAARSAPLQGSVAPEQRHAADAQKSDSLIINHLSAPLMPSVRQLSLYSGEMIMKAAKPFITATLTLCFIFLPHSIFAQTQNPSLIETIDWLRTKTEYIHSISSRIPRGEDNVLFPDESTAWQINNPNGCTLAFSGRTDGSERKRPIIRRPFMFRDTALQMDTYPQYSVTFSLADINPDNIELSVGDSSVRRSYPVIRLRTTDSRRVVNWIFVTKETAYDSGNILRGPRLQSRTKTRKLASDDLSITVSSQDMAQRMMRAFQHAISLCGGKRNSREPF
jgi:hypothetical protein